VLFELINFENLNARQANYTKSTQCKNKQSDRLACTTYMTKKSSHHTHEDEDEQSMKAAQNC